MVQNDQGEANSMENKGSRRKGSRGRVAGGATLPRPTSCSSLSSLPLGHSVPRRCFSLSLNSRSRIVEASVPEAHLFRASRVSMAIATTGSTRTLPRSYARKPSPTTAGGGGGQRKNTRLGIGRTQGNGRVPRAKWWKIPWICARR